MDGKQKKTVKVKAEPKDGENTTEVRIKQEDSTVDEALQNVGGGQLKGELVLPLPLVKIKPIEAKMGSHKVESGVEGKRKKSAAVKVKPKKVKTEKSRGSGPKQQPKIKSEVKPEPGTSRMNKNRNEVCLDTPHC